MMSKQKADFKIEFDIGTIKHLGLQMYSTLPPVIGELVANAWDADAEHVSITIPKTAFTNNSQILIKDDGEGMSDKDVRSAYLIVGRDRRKDKGDKPTKKHRRRVMGHKGIGKFSAFGIAGEIEIETVKAGDISRFQMSYAQFEKYATERKLFMPAMPSTGVVKKGTRVTLRKFSKFRNRSVNIAALRRGLARRFAVIGDLHKFEVKINGAPITAKERDLKRLLDKDQNNKKYIWEYQDQEIKPGTGWTVSGWIGALDRTTKLDDGIQHGIALMARGKLVQEPFVFDAVVGQQFALSYLIGELHAEFVDDVEDTVATTRNSLVWDAEANAAFKEWGQKEVNRIAREWAERRKADNETQLAQNPLYKQFLADSEEYEDHGPKKVADKLIRETIAKNPLADVKDQQPIIQMCLDFLEFDAFRELANELTQTKIEDVPKIVDLFREWEVVEAKEMMRVTEGRIKTIEKLQKLIDKNALEVPTLHNFLKEFPWVLDPRWNLIADEKKYSKLLKDRFPEAAKTPEQDRRIDFLCVRESNDLIVVEIKRPRCKASLDQLNQIEEYVIFMRDHVSKTTDPEMTAKDVIGYLLVGDAVNTPQVRGRMKNLADARIYVRKYSDLLRMVERNHKEFLDRYDKLRKAKKKHKSKTN
jgi:hypothetical protein